MFKLSNQSVGTCIILPTQQTIILYQIMIIHYTFK